MHTRDAFEWHHMLLATLKGNCHELRMHLSKFVCGNMPGFLATFRSRNLLFRSGVISFAAKGPL